MAQTGKPSIERTSANTSEPPIAVNMKVTDFDKPVPKRKMGAIGYGRWYIRGWLRHHLPWNTTHTLVHVEQWDKGKIQYHGWRCWHCDYTEGEQGEYERDRDI